MTANGHKARRALSDRRRQLAELAAAGLARERKPIAEYARRAGSGSGLGPVPWRAAVGSCLGDGWPSGGSAAAG